jgi:hypothetical protein
LTPIPVFVAGIAVGALAMTAIYFIDAGLAVSRNAAAPAGAPKPKSAPAVTTQSGVVLLPGETLVAPAPEVAALPPPPAAEPEPKPHPSPAPAKPRYTKPAPPPVVAQAPQYSSAEARDSFGRSVCLNCGVVTAITRGDYDWEVRVRFGDGSRETLRYYDRPRLGVGDTFHFEDGRLIPD